MRLLSFIVIALLTLAVEAKAEQLNLVCDTTSESGRKTIKMFVFIDTDLKYVKAQETHFSYEFKDGFVGPIVTGGDWGRKASPPTLTQFVSIEENVIRWGATGRNIRTNITLDRRTGIVVGDDGIPAPCSRRQQL
jgi:hypothetical protein